VEESPACKTVLLTYGLKAAAGQKLGIVFFIVFPKNILSAETIPGNSRKCFKGQKYSENSQNSRKVSRDILGQKQSK
jgi:hypothetical protein